MNIFAWLTLVTLQLGQGPVMPDRQADFSASQSVEPDVSPEALDRAFSGVESRTRGVDSVVAADPPLATPTKEPVADPAQKAFIAPQDQFKQWYHDVYGFVTTNGLQLFFNLLAAVVIFFVGRKLAKLATHISAEVMERVGTDPILVKFGSNLLYCALLAMISLASLQVMGVKTDSAVAMIAAAGFAVGLALQGSLANFAAGIMLIVFKPFNVGDEIEAGGQSGSVDEVNMFNTILRTNGNVKIFIPNGQVTSGTIKNFTAQRIRLIDLRIGCGYCDDLPAVKAFLDRVVRTDTRIVKEPAPAVAVAELADSCVVFSVKCWVATREFGIVRSTLLERIKLGFDQEGFTFPYPSRDVYVHQAITSSITKAA